jgi:hypothetical protein
MKAKPAPRPKFFPMPSGSSGRGWHEIQPFTMCPKEYQFARLRKISPNQVYMSEAFSFGLYVHAARAQWLYDNRQGDLWKEAMKNYGDQCQETEKFKLHPKSYGAALRDFQGYVDYWRVRPNTQPIAIEYMLEARPLIPNAPQWTWRTARLDSIERDISGKIWIGEFKSTGFGVGKVNELYALHGQILLQACLWGEEETSKFGPLAGILMDPLVKGDDKKPGKGGERLQLPLANMQHAMQWFRKDFTTWVMQASMIDWNSWVERRPVCMRAQGPCTYRALCKDGRDAGLDYVTEDGEILTKWKPTKGKEVPPWE